MFQTQNSPQEQYKNTIAYYDGIASGYDELYGEEQVEKINLITRTLTLTNTMRLLDVGCGTGISTVSWPNIKPTNAYGCDPSSGLLEIARHHYPTTNFQQAPAEDLPYKDNEFDIVTSLTAIQNFYDIEKGLKEIQRVGKDKFILTFLRKSSKAPTIDSLIQKTFTNYKRDETDKDIIYTIGL